MDAGTFFKLIIEECMSKFQEFHTEARGILQEREFCLMSGEITSLEGGKKTPAHIWKVLQYLLNFKAE
jgi:hypothetical protein